jgi:DNA-binding CsgD family transcriptional regulator
MKSNRVYTKAVVSVDEPVLRLTPDPEKLASLSNREREVLSLASAGYVDKWIAARMGVSANTLRTYWTRIRGKLGEVPRTALVAAFVEREMAEVELTIPTFPVEVEWYLDLDRDTYHLLTHDSMITDLKVGQEMSVEWLLDHFVEPERGRMESLIESARQGRLSVFHFVAKFKSKNGVELASALCLVQRDEAGRPIGIHGRRVPSMDLRGEQGMHQTLGQWGFTLPGRAFWADRDCRAIFRIDTTDPEPYATLVSRIHAEDRSRFERTVAKTVTTEEPLNRLAYRLDTETSQERWIMLDLRIEQTGKRKQLLASVMPLT